MQPLPRFSIACPTTVHFGCDAHRDLISALPQGAKHIVLVRGASGRAAAPVLRLLQEANYVVSQVTCAQEPSVPFINDTLETLDGQPCEALIACGGGAVMDTGKALGFALSHGLRLPDDFTTLDPQLLAHRCTLPCIALPTTAGTGAEVTANAVLDIPAQRAKISLRGRALYPAVAIVDPTLMMGAPPAVVLHAGLDAVTQIIEAYTSAAATPFSDALTAPAVAQGLRALAGVVDSGDETAWTNLAWVSLSSGLALANSGLGAAHGLASVLGARYGAPHGALCGRLLLPVLRRNLAEAAEGSPAQTQVQTCCNAIAEAFAPHEGEDVLSGFDHWMTVQGLARLGNWGVTQNDIPALAAAGQAASSSKKNAVALEVQAYAQILQEAL